MRGFRRVVISVQGFSLLIVGLFTITLTLWLLQAQVQPLRGVWRARGHSGVDLL